MNKHRPKIFFRVKNFKSLENSQIEISPLTFLFGPNGSGKSSLFKALRFLRANLFPLATQQLKFKLDEHTDLGSYKEVILNGNTSKRIVMEIEIDSSIWSKIISEHEWLLEDKLEESMEDFNRDFATKDLIPLKYRYSGDDLAEYKIIDDRSVFEIKSDVESAMEKDEEYDEEDEDKYFYLGTMRARGGDLGEDMAKSMYYDYNLSFPFKINIEFSFQNNISIIDLIRIENKIDKSFIEFYPSLDNDSSDSKKTISIFNNPALDDIFQYFYDNFWGIPFAYDNIYEFMGALHKFIYHKVQKKEIWRESSYEQKKKIYNKIKYWYYLMYQYVPHFLESFLDIDHLPPVREEPKELYLLKKSQFNDKEYYGLPSFLSSGRRHIFLNKKLNEFRLAKGIRVKKEKSVGFLQYKPNEKSYYTDLKEASSGLLQVLPVLFKSYIANKLFIEQPELHLHPSLQALLAEYFAVVIKEKDLLRNPFILIETHSEHLIRKIQVCIAKGILKKEDVGVFYFDKDFGTGKTKLKEMVIEENGFFKESWPNGFFDDSYNLTKELLRANKN